jgi:peroxiredoxin
LKKKFFQNLKTKYSVMKKLVILSLITLFANQIFAQDIQPLAIGSSIPMAAVKMKSVNGSEYSIKDVANKNGVLVMFSCNTCPVVRKYQGRTLQAIKEAQKNGIGVIVVNSNEGQRSNEDSYSAMQTYAKAQNYTVPYVVDNNSALANAFGATRTPECFLFNASGKLVYHGAIDNNQEAESATRNHLISAVSETVSGKDVTVKESRSVGCSIKRP